MIPTKMSVIAWEVKHSSSMIERLRAAELLAEMVLEEAEKPDPGHNRARHYLASSPS